MGVAVSVEYISISIYHVTNRYWYKSHIVSLSANKIIYIGIVILSVSCFQEAIIIISAAVVVWQSNSLAHHIDHWNHQIANL